MEKLPRGSNFTRAKWLWEIGLDVAGNPATPYGGDRDMCITVGNGSGAEFRPALRMATGSPILMHAVANGSLDMAIVNPSALLTQAYRGTGMFSAPLPLSVVANWPTWDWFALVFNPKCPVQSLREVAAQRYPLHVSVKEDVTHSTRVFIDQLLGYYGFSLAELVSWGGRLNLTGSPTDPRRMGALEQDELDAIFDEGLVRWLDAALARGMVPREIEPGAMAHMQALGWKPIEVPTTQFKHLKQGFIGIDYSGWPLYCRADFSEKLVYEACAAIVARQDEIPWEANGYTGDPAQVWERTFSTPSDVPLHPGAERFLREHRKHT